MALSTKEEYITQCMTTGKTREECEQAWNKAHKTADQQTKTEYITECVAGGKTKEECEAAWNEAHQAGDYATVFRELHMERAKNRQLTKMLREATDIIKAVNAEKDAVSDARKYELAVEIERATDGRKKHGDLMKESLNDLTIMHDAIDSAKPKDFVSVSMLLDESERKKKPHLSVGEWDPIAKKYKGGR